MAYSFLSEKKKTIFVDYFDTLCFRRIHSSQMYNQWAKCLLGKIPILATITDKDRLVKVRIAESKELLKNNEEAPYRGRHYRILCCKKRDGRIPLQQIYRAAAKNDAFGF